MKHRGMSTGIPKSVREAMYRQAVNGPHPAADLLTAYAERALTEQEEALVVGHLATCTECRGVVFLANSAYEAPAKPVVVYERRSMLRWAMPATALLAFAIGFFVLLRTENPNATRTAQLTKGTEQTATVKERDTVKIESNVADKAAPAIASAQIAPAAKLETHAKTKLAHEKSLARTSTDKTIARLAQDQPQVAAVPPAALAPPGYAGTFNGMTGAKTNSYPATGATASSMQITGGDVNSGAPRAQRPISGPVQAANQSATQNVSADTVEVQTSAGEISTQTAPSLQKQSDAELQAFAPSPMMFDARQRQRSAISRMAITVWRISSDGHLERMMQDQWKRALGSVQKSFRAVAYLGNHVWAGGAGPELYHSADGGENWNTLKVKTEDAELKGAMQSIKATDDKHVAIIADDGSVWVTANGGQTWTKQ